MAAASSLTYGKYYTTIDNVANVTGPAAQRRRPAAARPGRQPLFPRQHRRRAQGARRTQVDHRRPISGSRSGPTATSTDRRVSATATAPTAPASTSGRNYNRPAARLRPARGQLQPAPVPVRRSRDRGLQSVRQCRHRSRRRTGSSTPSAPTATATRSAPPTGASAAPPPTATSACSRPTRRPTRPISSP